MHESSPNAEAGALSRRLCSLQRNSILLCSALAMYVPFRAILPLLVISWEQDHCFVPGLIYNDILLFSNITSKDNTDSELCAGSLVMWASSVRSSHFIICHRHGGRGPQVSLLADGDSQGSISSRSYPTRIPCSQSMTDQHAATCGIDHAHLDLLLDRHPQYRRDDCLFDPLRPLFR